MKKKVTLLLSLALSVAAFSSCGKKSTDTPNQGGLKVQEHTQSHKSTSETDWVYFSFVTGKEVEGVTEESRLTRTDWDIAFNGVYIRTNSGLSGSGKGGALKTDKKSLAAVTEAPTVGYATDEAIKLKRFMGKMVEFDSTGNPVLQEAVQYFVPPMPPKYVLNDHVFVVRTAEGKYAKVLFISYANERGENGHVTMQYVYQPDGTPTFK